MKSKSRRWNLGENLEELWKFYGFFIPFLIYFIFVIFDVWIHDWSFLFSTLLMHYLYYGVSIDPVTEYQFILFCSWFHCWLLIIFILLCTLCSYWFPHSFGDFIGLKGNWDMEFRFWSLIIACTFWNRNISIMLMLSFRVLEIYEFVSINSSYK